MQNEPDKLEVNDAGVTLRFVSTTSGKCGECFNDGRALMQRPGLSDGICESCWQRSVEGAGRRDGHSKLIAEDGELKTVDAHPESNGPKIVAQMSITLSADGSVSVTGPLERRDLILQMVIGALDISYEVAKAVQERARVAALPPPKKWSKAWFEQQFARRRVAQQLREKAGANLAKGSNANAGQ